MDFGSNRDAKRSHSKLWRALATKSRAKRRAFMYQEERNTALADSDEAKGRVQLRSPDARVRVPANVIAKRSRLGSTGSPWIRPEERSGRRSKRRSMSPRVARQRNIRAISATPARREHRRETANPWGRLLLVTFLGEARKVTGPARPRSALVADQPTLRRTSLVGINLGAMRLHPTVYGFMVRQAHHERNARSGFPPSRE